jgi:hypothetical protein
MNALSDRVIDTFSSAKDRRVALKRRKIESYFQEMDNVTEAIFTIGSEESKEGLFGGYFLRLNGKAPYKPLVLACEGYCLDAVSVHPLTPVFYALVSLYSLSLTKVSVSFYIVSSKILQECEQVLDLAKDLQDPIEKAVRLLLLSLPDLKFGLCVKGPFFEKMQSKLYLAKTRGREEVESLNFSIIAHHILKEEIVL